MRDCIARSSRQPRIVSGLWSLFVIALASTQGQTSTLTTATYNAGAVDPGSWSAQMASWRAVLHWCACPWFCASCSRIEAAEILSEYAQRFHRVVRLAHKAERFVDSRVASSHRRSWLCLPNEVCVTLHLTIPREVHDATIAIGPLLRRRAMFATCWFLLMFLCYWSGRLDSERRRRWGLASLIVCSFGSSG